MLTNREKYLLVVISRKHAKIWNIETLLLLLKLTQYHSRVMPLDLERMSEGTTEDVNHDIQGILANDELFIPRFAQ